MALLKTKTNYPSKPQFLKDAPIEELKLPVKIESALKNGHIMTIGRFFKRKRKRLHKIKNLGPRSVSYLMKLKRNIELVSSFEPEPFIQESDSKSTALFQNVNTPLRFSRNHSIEVLGLPIRLENALKYAGIHRLGELYDYPEEKLRKLRNVGPKSTAHISSLKDRLVFGLKDNYADSAKTEVISDKALIDDLIGRSGNPRGKEIIERRYGLINGEKETLEEIGKNFGVTRERVRQIQMKAIKRMRHPSTLSRKPIIELVEKTLVENDWIISDEEADKLMPKVFPNLHFDGSSFLGLLVDLGWIQMHEVGDVIFYFPKTGVLRLGTLMDGVVKVLKRDQLPMTADELSENLAGLNKVQNSDFNLPAFIKRCCKIDPRIEEKIIGKYGLFVSSNRTLNLWIPLMMQILQEEQAPLHFTEIADRVNDLLVSSGHQLEQRRAHAILVQNKTFAHVGIRGTYGLTKWGLRKEPTIEIVAESIKKAGFPLHFEQIYDYVSRYKDSPKMNIRSILDLSGKFVSKGRGFYDLKAS